MKQNLVLFDFDGTISKKDSMIEFLKFYGGEIKLFMAYLKHSYWLISMLLGLVEKGKVKEKMWFYFFKDAPAEEFEKKAIFFSLKILPTFLYQEALQSISKHQKKGDRIIIVSASAEDWLKPWCQENNLELIATQLKKENGYLTGKLLSKNCKGPEKVTRIKQLVDITKYDAIFVYGDSSGDKEMLEIATHPYYRKFKA